MKKIATKITIDDFMKLWEIVRKKEWDKLDPKWGVDIKKIWQAEILDKFNLSKSGGSYGKLEDSVFASLLQNTENTFLPRAMEYKDEKYKSDFPYAYTRYGHLKREMGDSSIYQWEITANGYKFVVKIPEKTYGSVPGKYYSVKGGYDAEGYEKLEERRSFIKSSFVLTWPKILERTLKGIK